MSIGHVKAIKIYGERNSGTNYLEKLIQTNLNARVVAGNDTIIYRKIYKSIKSILPYPAGDWIVEKVRDRRAISRFDVQMGWKHAAIPCFPKEQSCYPGGTGFVTLTKNPYAWLLSLYKRPYQNMKIQRIGMSFEEFLVHSWPTVGREGGVNATYENPIQLWNEKTKSYALLKEYGYHIHFRYEDILVNFNDVLKKLAQDFELAALKDPFEQIQRSTKPGSSQNTDYASYYLEEKWRQKLTPKSISIINEFLDEATVNSVGYEMIDGIE